MGLWRSWALAVAALCAVACGGAAETSPQPGSSNVSTKIEPEFGERAQAVPIDQPGISQQTSAHLNLQNLVHLADIEHDGLFVDFGTPARMKYTVGHWKTGWGKDGAEGDTTYSYVGTSGRLYFPLAGAEPFTLRLRLQPIGTSTVQAYLNNEALPAIRLDKGAGFAEYDIAVPEGIGRPGENHLLLRFGGTTKIGDDEIAVALDWLRVMPAAPSPTAAVSAAGPKGKPAQGASPTYGSLIKELLVDSQKRKAITVRAPTTLSYYVDVPAGAKLSFRVASPDGKAGTARAQVRVSVDGDKPTLLWKGELGTHWQEQILSLEPWAASVVKLELIALGDGVVGFSSPSILAPGPASAQLATPARSVVLLLIDTLRADHLRAYDKNSRVKTPVLDALAAQGGVFEAAQSPENWTKPSVASVLTGLYPMSHGTKKGDSRLSERATVLSEVFKQAGYATASFIANGYVSDKFGFDQGWDYYTNYIRETRNADAESVFRDAGNWVEQHKGRRFFAYIHTIDPHVPYDPPEQFLKLYDPEPYDGPIKPRLTPDQLEKAKSVPPKLELSDRDRHHLEALYDGEISYHDHHLGLFIERLKKLGVYEQVMFVVTADHGEEFADHGSYGHGHTVYQELLHVPFILRYAGHVPSTRVRETVSTVDIAPTLLSGSGIAVPAVMEGTDRIPQLLGKLPAGPGAAFSDFLDDRRAIRAGRWKLILRGLTPTFFDLERDPREQVELDLKAYPIALRYCRILLGQFMGAKDRGDWLTANPKGRSIELKSEAAELDEATKAGLKALGYAN
jgi:choline-sulfatase